METILALDSGLFLYFYNLPHNSISEFIALFFSAVGSMGIIWFVIALFLFYREEKRDHAFFKPVIFVVFGGLFSEFVLKNVFARPRPTEIITSFSFPSTHATLAFAFAYVLSQKEPKLKYWFFTLAIFIALSRIYLGVHYPFDILAGAFLGIIIGWFSLMLSSCGRQKSTRKWLLRSKKIR